MSRIEPKLSVIKTLFALSGNQCAFPGCKNMLISKKGSFIGQLCHIEAANENGPRFNSRQTENERRAFENLLLMCYEHHKEIDDFVTEYTVNRLKQIKRNHEDQFRVQKFEISDDALEKAQNSIHADLMKIVALSEDTNQVAHKINESVLKILNQQSSKTDLNPEEIYIKELLLTIRELRVQHKHKTALDLLLSFEEKNLNKINPEYQYKLLANIAFIYLDIHQKDKAAEFFQKIERTNFVGADSLAFLCMGFAIAGNFGAFDEYFKKALNLAPDNENLWIAYIERFKSEKSIDEIFEALPEAVRDSTPLLFTIGSRMADQGKKADGISFLKKVLQRKAIDPEYAIETKVAIATQLIKHLVDPLKFYFKTYTKEELEELEEARSLYTEAWEAIRETEAAKFKWFIILNRGLINKVTNRPILALEDLRNAYDISHEFLAFKNLYFMYLQLDQVDSTLELFDRAIFARPLNDEERFEMKTFEARSAILLGKNDESFRLLSDLLEGAAEKQYIEVSTHIIAASIQLKQPELGFSVSEQLISKYPTQILGYIGRGYLYKILGEKEAALRDFDKANKLINESTPIPDINLLVAGYMDLEEYEKSIPLFEKLIDRNVLNGFSRGLIQAYFQFGDLEAAFAIAINLHKTHPDNVYLTEVISTIYHETKQFDKAIAVLKNLLPSKDDRINDMFSFRCARLYGIKRDWENVSRMITHIRHPENFALTNSYNLAWLFFQTGDVDTALKIAFQTRSRFFNEVNAHVNYINLLVSIKRDDSLLFPSTVKLDSAVQLKIEGGEVRLFLITDIITGENVLPSNDRFAMQLLGKSKGERFPIEDLYKFSNSATIEEITDLFTYAFRETLSLLATRFAGQHEIGLFQGDQILLNDTIEDFIRRKSMDHKERDNFLYNLYNQRKATIGMLAWSNRRNQIKQMFVMLSSSEIYLLSFTKNENHAIQLAIEGRQPIVLELTSLITVFFLFQDDSLLTNLPNLFLVSESTINELQSYYEELEQPGESDLFSIGFEEGKLVGHKTPKENIQKHRRVLADIIEWCKQNSQIVVPKKLISLKREERNRYSEILGDCSFDTMLLAEEYQAAVLSDDDNFKSLLLSEKTPLHFSTYTLVNLLVETKGISVEQFNNFRKELVFHNYCFIPVSAEILWMCFDASDFQVRKPFITAAKGLNIMLPLACSKQVVGFAKKLYLENILFTTRDQVMLYLFNEVSIRQDFSIVRNLLVLTMQQELRLLPNYRDNLLQLLRSFKS